MMESHPKPSAALGALYLGFRDRWDRSCIVASHGESNTNDDYVAERSFRGNDVLNCKIHTR